MGLFNFGKKNQDQEQEQEQRQPGNPSTMLMFRLLAIGYVLWMLKGLVEAYIAGGEDAPSLLLLLGAIAVLGGGCAWVGWMTYKQWKMMKEADRKYREEMAREAEEEARLEAERAALEEEYPDDAVYYEDEEEEEFPEEE